MEIAPGSTSTQIGRQLEQAGVVRSRYAFDAVRMWKRGVLKAGEYRFDHAVAVPEVYARIARGDVYTIPVTIPEGANRFDIASRIAQGGWATREDFLAATVKQTSLMPILILRRRAWKGYLVPDTYRFPRKETAAQIVAAMVRRFRAAAAQVGLKPGNSIQSVHSIVTLSFRWWRRETALNLERRWWRACLRTGWARICADDRPSSDLWSGARRQMARNDLCLRSGARHTL